MQRIKQRSHFLFLFVFYGFCCCLPAMAGNVTLAWNPVSATNLAGYKVYYGTASGTYTASISAGTQTTYTISRQYPAGRKNLLLCCDRI